MAKKRMKSEQNSHGNGNENGNGLTSLLFSRFSLGDAKTNKQQIAKEGRQEGRKKGSNQLGERTKNQEECSKTRQLKLVLK